jgi:hypothetical protein
MLRRVQRIINIKIVKAYRTISFEASFVIAGVASMRLVLEEKVNQYKTKHNPECIYHCQSRNGHILRRGGLKV